MECLGHFLTPDGLKPNLQLVTAVIELPMPQNIREVRQLLGLSSYYRWFIPRFARIARPLHKLTHNEADFIRSQACQAAFETLTEKLIQSPVLSFPSFNNEFTLELMLALKVTWKERDS